MMTIQILEHSSSGYGPRTYANAAKANLTLALSVDDTTTGERCTHKAAGKKLLKLDLAEDWIVNARLLWHRLVAAGVTNKLTLNVAGNGIVTLNKHGWSQSQINEYVYWMLEKVHTYFHIDKIVSGGQTGVDIAGGWVGVKLGIDVELLLPKGYIQRHEDGIDVKHTKEQIMKQVTTSCGED